MIIRLMLCCLALSLVGLIPMKLRANPNTDGGRVVSESSSASERLLDASKTAISEERFIDLFRKDFKSDSNSTGVEKRRKAAENYINACCNNREAVIALLEKNKFKVRISDHMEPEILKRSIREIKGIQHNEVISGVRSPGLLQFWRIFTLFRIYVYFHEGKVVHVFAVVDTTLP